ncbi:diaminopimelate decarboxylase [Gammaproteobacteria bacterium LSUCC0057]|uniref:Diaminopimelate decarboxylase n=1 Tax=Gammaproteobacteria bacterium LSUCC0057 TaxID=2559237 RepID=A0A4Y8UGS8_9GAMM|nr:diaminopimelate decarboxylase [Gammaproteobacteria bacterium LSUCC0057]
MSGGASFSHFSRRDGELYIEQVALNALANQFGTPCYVYSAAVLRDNFDAYSRALQGRDHLICYAVKACSNIAILQLLARRGAGFDIVSVGELERVLLAGGDPAKVVFSGVAKTASEMRRALDVGIHCFNVESAAELEVLAEVAAAAGQRAAVSLRVNPDVDAGTHPYISTGLKENKFGVAIEQAEAIYQRAAALPSIEVVGVDCHIGSQLTDATPLLDALERLLALVDRLDELGIPLQHIDLGGGLGVRYRDEQPPTADAYLSQVLQRLEGRPQRLVLEPGRSIVANSAVLLTETIYLKQSGDKHFAIVDAAMNDMLRPSLYQAWMALENTSASDAPERLYDVVGPVCETGDWLAKERPLRLRSGDRLAMFSAGAYGFTMASNYNSRTRAAEILVDGEQVQLIRERETLADLTRGEHLLDSV